MMTEKLFDTFETKNYRFCCGCLHIETGTKIVCGIFLISNIHKLFNFFSNGTEDYWRGIWIIFQLLIVIGALIGIKKVNHRYFIPFLCHLTFITASCSSLLIKFGLALFPDKTTKGYEVRNHIEQKLPNIPSETFDYFIIGGMVFCGISILFLVWLFSIVYKGFKYISELKDARCYYDQMILPSTKTNK